MTDDMQRAREFINQDQIGIGSEFCGFTQVVSLDAALEAITAALRAVPEVTPEMVAAAEDAYMPFGDMQLAIQCALAARPQGVELFA